MVLASASPRRKDLLKELTADFKVVDSGYVEPISFSPHEFAITNAKCKAAMCNLSETVLAADTIVVLDSKILGKPKNESEAFAMLRGLSGRTHKVITGICICVEKRLIVDCDESGVEFDVLTDEEISRYIASGSPFDKAGGYGIQDEFIRSKVKSIRGSLNNIIGLPTELIARLISLHKIKL